MHHSFQIKAYKLLEQLDRNPIGYYLETCYQRHQDHDQND